MTATFALITMLEIAFVALLILGFVHEDKVIAFEDKLAHALAQTIKARRAKRHAAKKEKCVQSQRRAELAASYAPQQKEQPKKKKGTAPHRVA